VQFSNLPKGYAAVGHGHKLSGKLWIAGTPPVSGVYDAAGRLFVTRLDDTAGTPPSLPPGAPNERWWAFENMEEKVLDTNSENFDIRYSWANKPVGPINQLRAHYVDPYYTDTENESLFFVSRYNYYWFLSDVFFYNFTEDSDGNGRIDRIRAQSVALLDSNKPAEVFAGFDVSFPNGDYEVDSSKGTRGYAFVPGTSQMIYIYLKEKDYPDTGARPYWNVVNTSLWTLSTNLVGVGAAGVVPIDTAPPRISYTLAVPGDNKVYVRMSEPVLLDSSVIAAIKGKPFADLPIADVSPINPSDDYTDEFYITLDGPLPASAVVNGTAFPLSAFDGLVDRNYEPTKIPQPPTNEPIYPNFPKEYPGSFDPSFAFTYVSVPNKGVDLNPPSFKELISFEGVSLGLKTEIPNRFNADSSPDGYGVRNRDQRASDILIMVEPDPLKGLADPHFSVWPLRMRDDTEAVADDENNIVGLVERYDGRGRLRPPTINTEIMVRAGLNKNDLERSLGLYFSSLREFGGLRFAVAPGDKINLPLVMSSLSNAPGIWLPGSADSGNAAWLPKNYRDLRWFFLPSSKTYGDRSGKAYMDHIPVSSAKRFAFNEISDGHSPMKEVVFVFPADENRKEPLYGLWLDTWTAGDATVYTFPDVWWTREHDAHKFLKPFNLIAFGIVQQVGGVTILNNVIDSTKQERTILSYTLTKRGRTTANVFTFDGTLVKRIVSETQNPGEYTVSWDGKNQSGRPVARGMYFIRIVAPDIDEVRKVMVIK
jgi:hypothetical protein